MTVSEYIGHLRLVNLIRVESTRGGFSRAALKLAGVPAGVLSDDKVRRVRSLPEEITPLHILCIGNAK